MFWSSLGKVDSASAFFSLFSYKFWQALSLFLMNLMTMAAIRKHTNTMIQVNWLEKKFAVL